MNLRMLAGASFVMAATAIGPGFLTQTSRFTGQFMESMLLIVACVVFLDVVTQLNTWRVIGVSGLRAQEIANKIFPGLGFVVAFLVALGGFAFAIGDIGGATLGMNVMFGFSHTYAAIITCLLSIVIFLSKNAKTLMDKAVEIIGICMILLMVYFNIDSPPTIEVSKVVEPLKNMDSALLLVFPIITMLGGSAGGYIAFSGGHRLIDAGITGIKNLGNITKSALLGVGVSASMRILLFLAVLGVLHKGFVLDASNPAASAFEAWGGNVGFKIFGVLIFFAAISSLIGGAYSSVSFLKTFYKPIEKYENIVIIAFIIFASALVVLIQKPIAILIVVGTLNGLILPIMLSVVLLASRKKDIVGEYRHPASLIILGVLAIILSAIGGIVALPGILEAF